MVRRKKRRVNEPLTEELLQELLCAPDPQTFTKKHRAKRRDVSSYLQQLLDERGLRRIDVIHEAGLNETFGYQIFTGQRNASRDKILQLVFAMQLSLTEANRLMQTAGVNELYCKNRRDAIIIFCLTNRYSLQRTDEELYRFNESTICLD